MFLYSFILIVIYIILTHLVIVCTPVVRNSELQAMSLSYSSTATHYQSSSDYITFLTLVEIISCDFKSNSVVRKKKNINIEN